MSNSRPEVNEKQTENLKFYLALRCVVEEGQTLYHCRYGLSLYPQYDHPFSLLSRPTTQHSQVNTARVVVELLTIFHSL